MAECSTLKRCEFDNFNAGYANVLITSRYCGTTQVLVSDTQGILVCGQDYDL